MGEALSEWQDESMKWNQKSKEKGME